MFSWLFGESGNKALDTISSAADSLVFTDQEKTSLFIEFQKATLPQNLARRLIATMIVGLFCFLILLAVIIWQYQKEYAEYIFKVLSDVMVAPVTVIISFYFLKRFSMGGKYC